MAEVKLKLKLKDVPENEYVTKVNGTVRYKVKDRLNIYSESGGRPQEVMCDGCRILMKGENFVFVGLEKEFVWETSPESAIDFIREKYIDTE